MGLISGIGRPVIYSPSTGGGNTGLPLGPFDDWSGLPASGEGYALAFVNNIGPENSYGLAAYDSEGAEWQLLFGWFSSLADLNAFNESINSNALVGVGASLDGPTSTRFQWDSGESEWARTPAGTGYVWDLTDTELLTGADPSGIGLVQDGDWGTHTPASGAPIVVRYKAACDVAEGAGDGTLPMWLPPQVYAGNPEIKAYIVGTEANDTAIGDRGWTIARADTGTVGTVDGYMRLQGPTTAAPSGSSGTLTGPAFTGATKFYLVGEFRGTASGSDPYAGIFGNASASIPVQYALGTGNNSATVRQKTMPSASWANADTPSQIMNGGLTWPASVPYLLQALSGAAITDLIETRFDGELYSSFRRNFDSAVDASSYAFLLIANGGGGSTTSTLEFRNLYFLTY